MTHEEEVDEIYLKKAAQAWCYPETEKIEMDSRLAFAFAKILAGADRKRQKNINELVILFAKRLEEISLLNEKVNILEHTLSLKSAHVCSDPFMRKRAEKAEDALKTAMEVGTEDQNKRLQAESELAKTKEEIKELHRLKAESADCCGKIKQLEAELDRWSAMFKPLTKKGESARQCLTRIVKQIEAADNEN